MIETVRYLHVWLLPTIILRIGQFVKYLKISSVNRFDFCAGLC